MVDSLKTARHFTPVPAALPTDLRTSDPLAFLRQETQVRHGKVPHTIAGMAVANNCHLLAGDEFLLRDDAVSLHYRQGEGVTIERHSEDAAASEFLYLNGSVYAAAACINGFYPVHASAVAFGGQVHAFTGPSGAGKSTLIAGLSAAGLPMFCDDTLILDLSDPARPLALPGHKRLKLTQEALALTGAEAEEPVGAEVAKFYARAPGGDFREPLPLVSLAFLEEGPQTAIVPITGAQRIARLSDDHYTARLFHAARGLSPAQTFALHARLAASLTMARLVRPRDILAFPESLILAQAWIDAQRIAP